MEPHENLSLAIAASDLKYVGGSLFGAGNHPRSWPFAQWGAMVSYEAKKTLQGVHGVPVDLGWEDAVAEAARHGGKFFDGRAGQLNRVVTDFRELATATHEAFYPDNRRGREFDFLRDDLSVLSHGEDLLLTNVTGHFMVGLPSNRASNMDSWGPHLYTLGGGIGRLAGAFWGSEVEYFSAHGTRVEESLTWWDGKIEEVIPVIFGGEMEKDLALAMVSILSTVQCARRWARAECCGSCEAASLKHRFVVLHHAVRSMEQLANQAESIGPTAEGRIQALMASDDVRAIVRQPFRNLRNGWFHLGLGDIASTLPADMNILSPVTAYTGMEMLAFVELVERGLERLVSELGEWINAPGADGATLFDCLHALED